MSAQRGQKEFRQAVTLCLQGIPRQCWESNQSTWFALGVPATELDPLSVSSTDKDGFEAELCARLGDVTLIRVCKKDGLPVSLDVWKGITSCYDVFYTFNRDQGFIASDNVADLISKLPQSERSIASHAPIDHLLFRTVPGEASYLEAINRLGGGTHLSVDIVSGEFQTKIFDKISGQKSRASYARQLDRLEAALNTALEPHAGNPSVAGLFSGGVDSTVIHSFLNSNNGALNLVPKSFAAEWDFQKDYANDTAKLLHLPLETLPVLSGDIRRQVDDMTERLGVPLRDVKTGMYAEAFSSRFEAFTIGERADALFGAVGTRLVGVADLAPAWMLGPSTNILNKLAPGRIGVRAGQLRETLDQLSRPTDDPWGYGSLMACDGYTDFAILEEIFGKNALSERLSVRQEFTRNRVSFDEAQSNPIRHLELAHWIDYFCEDVLLRIRQLAHSYGKTLICPFLAKPVVDTALSIPANRRYLKGFETKHLLKSLLRRRVPQYPHGRRKGITGISMAEIYRQGHFADFWDEHQIPDFVPERLHASIRSHCQANEPAKALGQITWHVMGWALWESKTLKNANLCLNPNTEQWSA